MKAMKSPLKHFGTGLAAWKALPLQVNGGLPATFEEVSIADLPLIKHWPDDGGAFVTLPQVYSEDPEKPGIMNSNLGMYRIQLSGNEYELNKEIGLHYQIHRGIGVHQDKATKQGLPLKVSIFIGGPPAHTLSAVMPLPEGMSEITLLACFQDAGSVIAISMGTALAMMLISLSPGKYIQARLSQKVLSAIIWAITA